MPNYFYRLDMWNNGSPINFPVDRPESVRAIPGSTSQEIVNNSGSPVLVSFEPALGPETPGGSGLPMPPTPPVHLELAAGATMRYTDHPADAIQVWLHGGAPVAYAPVEVRAW